MNTLSSFFVCAGLLISSVGRAEPILEGFGGNSLNTNLWQAFALSSNSMVAVTNGVVTLRSSAGLLARRQLPEKVDLYGRFSFSGSSNQTFSVIIGTTGSVSSSGHIAQGYKITFIPSSTLPLTQTIVMSLADGRVVGGTNYPIKSDRFINFRIVDDGAQVSVSVDRLDRSNVTLPSPSRSGHLLVIQQESALPTLDGEPNAVAVNCLSVFAVPTMPQFRPDLGFCFPAPDLRGTVIETSEDLEHWRMFSGDYGPGSLVTDISSVNVPLRFYRTRHN